MPDIETLGILTINCNKIEMKEAVGLETCKTNMSQEINATEKSYTNTDTISKFENEDKSMVTDNDNNGVKYFLPGPNSNNHKWASTEITK